MTPVRLALAALLAVMLAKPVDARAEIGAYLLFDMADGTILAEHEATRLWYPASITKLMTAYVTFQAIEKGELKLTSPVTMSAQARLQPPSRMGFPVGTVLTVETALRILMTKSANDVAFALAEAVGGTLAGFVDRMNAAAAELGMTETAYDNPHGLPNTKQVTTARDIALLMMALAERYPDRADFFSMNSVRLSGRTMVNHNALMRRFPGTDGMKTGFICASGFNIAASATRGGRRLGAVVLGGLTSNERNQRTAELLDKGFQSLENGGAVALDGFDEPDGRLDLRAVTGTRPDLGTVVARANPPGQEAVDRRSEVCGASRPITRYSDGTVDSVAEIEEQRIVVGARRLKIAARDAQKAEILAAPRQAPQAFAPPASRRLADGELRPVAWLPGRTALLPLRHPERASEQAATEPTQGVPAPTEQALLAPADWIPSPARPQPNPFEVAGLRAPIGPPITPLPLTYLRPAGPLTPTPIALGGADDERPKPLSGSIVGGGRPPIPNARPALTTAAPSETNDDLT